MTTKLHTATRAVRAALETDTQHGAVVPPLYLSSNFAFRGFGDKRDYDYTRSGNPSRDALADALTELEGGQGAVVTASGMKTSWTSLIGKPNSWSAIVTVMYSSVASLPTASSAVCD